MKKSLSRTTFWTAGSTLIKILGGLLIMKLIAVYFGTEGVGRAANYMTLLTVLGVFAGAGIFNGVTKYVAQYEDDRQKLNEMLGTASSIILIFSFCLAAIGLFFADVIALFIFSKDGYRTVIRVLAIAQLGIALGNYLLAILKGKRDAKNHAIAVIAGMLIGVILFVSMMYFGQYTGALIGLALVPAITLLPAYDSLKKCGQNSTDFISLLKPNWHSWQAKKLFTFSLMVFTTAVTIPLAYIQMRNWLEGARSIHEVGLWQGISKISDAYLQFITAAFSVYLLPTLAKLTEKSDERAEIFKALKFVFPVTLAVSIVVYLCRSLIIRLLFSEQFLDMNELFIWQLIGDVFKVSTYIFGYLLVAKAALSIYILGELVQCILLLGLASYLIPAYGVVGATQSYMLAYMLYFGLCLGVFWFYGREIK